jgi:hypothetical protein
MQLYTVYLYLETALYVYVIYVIHVIGKLWKTIWKSRSELRMRAKLDISILASNQSYLHYLLALV